ncbi:hypothetical protein Ato02nite_074320 [Paractinoplanes toevensis]|uniref:Uncharacterized protein n=1 Tax=Paractinoplanes toevensis TaxID=571911 RepID=A0A919TK05_9ACTN|nr:hypothetical protein Ato02nite_074320 [Actinoplanes toevensis]
MGTPDLPNPFGRIGAEIEGEPGIGHGPPPVPPIVTRITPDDKPPVTVAASRCHLLVLLPPLLSAGINGVRGRIV